MASIDKAKSQGMTSVVLGGPEGVAKVWAPARFKRAYAAHGEPSAPYLRPYDVFNYFPEPADWLSTLRTDDLATYQLRRGMIIQTCSGRNLGPAVMVDNYLARFLLSHDMIRVEIEDKRLRHYVLAFLNSQAGRRMLRRDKTGSVIDHISEGHLAKLEILLLESQRVEQIADAITKAVDLREKARLALNTAVTGYEQALPAIKRPKPLRCGWTVSSEALEGRLDSAFYDPLVSTVRRHLTRLGGKRVSEVARVLKPAGRYKTCYVDRDNGRPLLSGAQLLQTTVINLQFMAPGVFNDITAYEVHAGWIAYPADGRAEEELGTPVFITEDRAGWLASGHVGRVIPKPGVDAGWLFLALKTSHAQMQLKARASGSVVDSTFPNDMEEVILPPQLDIDGTKVIQLWDDFREAQALEEQASAMVDDALLHFALQ
ncbi:MAG: hypothetical protein Q8S00_00570 [Deltaproteobacteria bacterium]|nr:hypothetical protein [Deltaproteobacteria bacterium]